MRLDIFYYNGETKDLAQSWEIGFDGQAVFTPGMFEEPLYKRIDGITPDQGEAFLKALEERLQNSTFLYGVMQH